MLVNFLREMAQVDVLFDGYCREISDSQVEANCSCTLIQTPDGKIVIVDTLTPWDGDMLKTALASKGVDPDQVTHVVSTHGHSDHTGNNNLFLKATHIVGHCISHKWTYTDPDFPMRIGEFVEVLSTPGHTLDSITVMVTLPENKRMAVTGDLFENQDDLEDDRIWINAGSESQEKQRQNRQMILELAHFIVPGHGKMFENKIKPLSS